MGLFDNIRGEYPLPLPPDQGELAGVDWARQSFQTKDLGEGMREYCIRPDGTLWQVKKGRLGEDSPEPVFRQDYSGRVDFYHSIKGQKQDYWVEWTAEFVSGKVQDLRLREWRTEDNRERREREAKWAEEVARRDKFLQTWVGRRVYPGYAWLVELLVGKGLGGLCRVLSRLLAALEVRLSRLEHWLTPHGNPIAQERHRRRWREWRQEHFSDEPK